MSRSVASKLEAARSTLAELGRLTENLATSYAQVFEEPELRSALDAFRRAHDEAQARLAAPTLRIATIGTTSAGKSTIVNALVGVRIAPIEAGEMSAGVLTLRSGSERRLTVEAADGAPWEGGTWAGISDADAYGRIRDGVMRRYHEARKESACSAPQVLWEGPLLPAIDSQLLGLPPGVGVEFLDLPGLKSVHDRANLEVIQALVQKAFSLVALDYVQTDEEHRKKLLEELTHVVKYLRGRTDSMIFVLNRVDLRNLDDDPIEKRVAALRKEIKEVLGLRHEPDVLPFKALLLYRAQCAWGASDETQPATTPEQRLEHLRALFQESASTLKQCAREHPKLRSWLRQIEDQVEEGCVPTDDDLHTLVERCREWSGGKELWQRLRSRLEESFAEMVILPAVIDVLHTHQSITDALCAVSKIRKIESQEKLRRARERVDQVQLRLHEEVGAIGERFCDRLTAAAQTLKTGNQAARHQLTRELGPGFEPLLAAVQEVTSDLTTSLIVPVRDALKTNRSAYDLEDEMNQVLEPALAKDLARDHDRFSRRIPTLRRGEGTLEYCVREDDGEGLERLKEIERDARRLYQRMREGLSARAEFMLQGHAALLRDALTGLLDQQADAIAQACLKDLPDLSLDQAIESARRAGSGSEQLKLPDAFFTLAAAVHYRRFKKNEKIGEREEVEHYQPDTCFGSTKTRIVKRAVMGTVPYKELVLPDEDEMARQWSDGVKAGEESMWEVLRDWMAGALRQSSRGLEAAVESVLRLAKRALEQQERLAADEHEAVVELWKQIDRDVDRLRAAWDRLSQAAQSEHG